MTDTLKAVADSKPLAKQGDPVGTPTTCLGCGAATVTRFMYGMTYPQSLCADCAAVLR